MSNVVSILWDKASDRAGLSGGSWVAGLPLANIQDIDIERVARSTSAATSATRFCLDGGTTPTPYWSQFVLLNHNATTTAQIRIVLTSDATDSDPAARVLDTGLLRVWVPTVVWGAKPWGSFPWDGVDVRDYPAGPTFFHLLAEPVRARYAWVYIEDSGNPAGYVQIGRFLAGQAWSPATNVDPGFSIRWVDPTPVRRTPQGRRITGTGFRLYRVIEMEFGGFLTEAEAWGVAFEIGRQLGKSGDLFFVADPTEDPAVRFRRAGYFAVSDPQAIAEPHFAGRSWRLTLEEIT